MSYTLAQVDNLTEDLLIRGVAQDVFKEDPLWNRLPVENVTGKSLIYNRESTTGTLAAWKTATFTQIGGALPESTPSTTQVTMTLAQLVDSARIPRFAIEVKGDIQTGGIEGFTHDMKLKALFESFKDALLYGDNGANSNEFSGIHRLVDNTLDDNLDISEAASQLNISNLNTMLDAVRRVTMILMNRQVRTLLSQAQYLATNVASNIVRVPMGDVLERYGKIPVMVTDFLTMTETDADPPIETGASNTSVIALNLDDNTTIDGGQTLFAQGPTIVQSAKGPHIVGPIIVPGESNIEFQYYWNVALIVPSRRTIGRVRGITNAAIAA